jgi:hypothetical protein
LDFCQSGNMHRLKLKGVSEFRHSRFSSEPKPSQAANGCSQSTANRTCLHGQEPDFFLKKGRQSSAVAERILASRIRRGSVATWRAGHSVWLGGSFGRRAKKASVSRATHNTTPPENPAAVVVHPADHGRRFVEGAASTQVEPATFYAHEGRVVFVSARQDTIPSRGLPAKEAATCPVPTDRHPVPSLSPSPRARPRRRAHAAEARGEGRRRDTTARHGYMATNRGRGGRAHVVFPSRGWTAGGAPNAYELHRAPRWHAAAVRGGVELVPATTVLLESSTALVRAWFMVARVQPHRDRTDQMSREGETEE